MATTTNLSSLVINYLTQAQYDAAAEGGTLNENQLYLTPSETLAAVATSGSYNDLSNKPTLATVATSGSYNDLSNKPAIYDLPIAASNTLGGIKTGYTTSGNNRAVQVDGNGNAYIIQADITNNITGTGTSGSIAKFNGTNSITNGPALGSSTTTFLRNDGSWATPPDTITTVTTTGSGNAVTAITASNGALTVTKGTTFQTNIGKLSLTLTTSNWSNNSQIITATGVTASNNVIISPAPASIDNYVAAGIKCTAQAANSLTFTCTTTPTVAISVNVLVVS